MSLVNLKALFEEAKQLRLIREDDKFEDQYIADSKIVIIRPCYNNDYNLHLTLKEAEWYLEGLIDAYEKLTGLANLNLVFYD